MEMIVQKIMKKKYMLINIKMKYIDLTEGTIELYSNISFLDFRSILTNEKNNVFVLVTHKKL